MIKTEKVTDAIKQVNGSKKSEIKKENKEQEYLERLQRLQAEFENFEKRTSKKMQEDLDNANARLISELLPIVDNFEASLKHNKDEGIALIYEELKDVLKKQGLKKIDTTGKFDPNYHEALVQEEGNEEGIILEEIQSGYLLNDRLLRASKVKISRLKQNE